MSDNQDLKRRTFVATNPSTGTQVLVTLWLAIDNVVHVEVATRPAGGYRWSPPLLDFVEVD